MPHKFGWHPEHVVFPDGSSMEYAQWNHPSNVHPFSHDIVRLARQVLKPGQWAIDIGAYIGDTAVPYALAVGESGKVFAFEPNPYAFEILAVNAEINRPKINIEAVPYAATPQPGKYIFHYTDTGYCNGGYASATECGPKAVGLTIPLEIEGVNVVDWLRARGEYDEAVKRLGFIKTDTEGFDAPVLASMRELINAARPVIMAEVYVRATDKELTQLYETIAGMGYIIYEVNFWQIDAPGLPLTLDALLMHRDLIRDIICFPQERLGHAPIH